MTPLLIILPFLSGMVVGGLLVTGSFAAVAWMLITRQEREPAERLDVSIGPTTAQGGKRVDISVLTVEQQFSLRVSPLTSMGRAAHIDGVPLFESSDPAVLAILSNPADAFEVKAVAIGEGEATLKITADADLGDGVRTLEWSRVFKVGPAGAEGLRIDFGPLEAQSLPDVPTAPTPTPAVEP